MRLDRPAVKLPTITNAEAFKSVVGATAVMTSIVTSKGSRQSTLCNEKKSQTWSSVPVRGVTGVIETAMTVVGKIVVNQRYPQIEKKTKR